MRPKEDPRRFMDPHVEYRPCPRLPTDLYCFGRDGSAWWRRRNGPWRRKKTRKCSSKKGTGLLSGYAGITVTIDGQLKHFLLGPLILSAFGRPRPLGMVCHYDNGNGMDVRLANLSWYAKGATTKGRIGTTKQRLSSAKLTDEKVIEARSLYRRGATAFDLAEDYGVHPVTMLRALNGETWSHVPGAIRLRRGFAYGTCNASAKLDEIDVAEIKEMLRDGVGKSIIARQFGVSWNAIYDIARGKTWIHVPELERAEVAS